MIKPKGDLNISIRSIRFTGAAELEDEGQVRGTDILEIEYFTVIRAFDEGRAIHRDVATTKNVLTLNGQFKDEEFKEAIVFFKKLAIKALKETNEDQGKSIDAAIDKINDGG